MNTTGQDALSALFGNLTEVDQNYYPAIEDVMKDSYGADGISVMEAGNNRFFKMTVPYQGKILIVYSTFFNDHTIDIMCYPAEDAFSDYDVETIETMLADLILS